MNQNAQRPYDVSIFEQCSDAKQMSHHFAILVTLEGALSIQLNDAKFALNPHEMIYIKPQDHYSIEISGPMTATAALITFRYNYFFKNFSCQVPELNLSAACYSQDAFLEIYKKTLDFIHKYFSENPTTSSDLYVQDYLYYLKEHAINEAAFQKAASKNDERIIFIRDYLENNYTAALTLGDLADELNITPQYLASFMKRHMNVTFNQYLYKIRLSYAVRDLVTTSDSITHIAFNYGFPNVAAFNRIFKQEYHMTPLIYRTQYKKNMTLLQLKEFTLPDFSQSLMLYQSYQKRQNAQKSQKEKHTRVLVEPHNIKTLSPVWSQILNVGYAKDLNDFAMHEQLKDILKEISFTYGRITGVVHPDVMPYIPETKTFDFHEVDTLMDILYELKLIPFIVLGKPEPVFDKDSQAVYIYTSNEYTDFSKAFSAFVRHAILRFGVEEFEKWKFEYSYNLVEEGYFSKNPFFYRFIKNSTEAYRILKKASPNSAFGGPNHRLAQSDRTVLLVLRAWMENGIRPDFFTLFAFPMERIDVETPSRTKPFSTNPHIHRLHLLEVKKHLKELYGMDIPIYITEFGYYFLNKRYISDSRFSAAYIVQNMLDLYDLCEGIALPAASDLHYRPVNSTQLLSGSNGILSIDGIRKPAYFALMFLRNLGQQCMFKAPGVIATLYRDDSYRLLLYNYKHPNDYYCAHPDYEITENNFEEIFTDHNPAYFDISLNFLPSGQYFVMEYSLTKDHGSILDKWLECGKGRNLLHHMIQHLKKHTDVDFTYQPITVTADTVLHYILEPHVIKMITIYPVDAPVC